MARPRALPLDPIIENRRERVAYYMLRHLNPRQITEALASEGILNPHTQAAYDRMTVVKDIEAIYKDWRKNTNASVEEHRARQLTELTQVKREAWGAGNHALVLTALSHEAKLTDTLAPMRINLDLVASLWNALETRGRDPEQVLKAMLKRLLDTPPAEPPEP